MIAVEIRRANDSLLSDYQPDEDYSLKQSFLIELFCLCLRLVVGPSPRNNSLRNESFFSSEDAEVSRRLNSFLSRCIAFIDQSFIVMKISPVLWSNNFTRVESARGMFYANFFLWIVRASESFIATT